MRNNDQQVSDIVAALQARDPRALEALYDQFGRRAFGLAYRILGNGQSAEDAVQEAFITLWNQAERIDSNRGQVGSLLMTIVHRRSIDILRSQRDMAARVHPLDDDTLDPTADDAFDTVARSMTYDTARLALETLAPEQREVIELAYFGGMTQVEIAEKTAVPVGTVKSRLRLALTRLRKELGVGPQ